MITIPRNKIFIFSLTACLALAAISAETFVFTHIDHDCTGEDCPVCLQIEIARNALKCFALALIATPLAAYTACANQTIKKNAYYFIRLVTPVTLNIKSNT
jgi:hypothetical protein